MESGKHFKFILVNIATKIQKLRTTFLLMVILQSRIAPHENTI